MWLASRAGRPAATSFAASRAIRAAATLPSRISTWAFASMGQGETGIGGDGAVKGLDRAGIEGKRKITALNVGVPRSGVDSGQREVVSVRQHGGILQADFVENLPPSQALTKGGPVGREAVTAIRWPSFRRSSRFRREPANGVNRRRAAQDAIRLNRLGRRPLPIRTAPQPTPDYNSTCSKLASASSSSIPR
jgi:hypothetical protein